MKYIQPFEQYNNSSTGTPLTEATGLKDYEAALTKHDWYYRMSDDDRAYRRGEAEEQNIRKLYSELDAADQARAFTLWADLYKRMYPHSDYAGKIKQSDFKGI